MIFATLQFPDVRRNRPAQWPELRAGKQGAGGAQATHRPLLRVALWCQGESRRSGPLPAPAQGQEPEPHRVTRPLILAASAAAGRPCGPWRRWAQAVHSPQPGHGGQGSHSLSFLTGTTASAVWAGLRPLGAKGACRQKHRAQSASSHPALLVLCRSSCGHRAKRHKPPGQVSRPGYPRPASNPSKPKGPEAVPSVLGDQWVWGPPRLLTTLPAKVRDACVLKTCWYIANSLSFQKATYS